MKWAQNFIWQLFFYNGQEKNEKKNSFGRLSNLDDSVAIRKCFVEIF